MIWTKYCLVPLSQVSLSCQLGKRCLEWRIYSSLCTSMYTDQNRHHCLSRKLFYNMYQITNTIWQQQYYSIYCMLLACLCIYVYFFLNYSFYTTLYLVLLCSKAILLTPLWEIACDLHNLLRWGKMFAKKCKASSMQIDEK